MLKRLKRAIEWVRADNFGAALTLFISTLLFFYDLYGERYLLTERDLAPYFIPPRFFWVESLKQGDLPLWNPYQFSGYPFAANPQHGLFYPPNILFLLLPFDIAFNTVIILHFFFGGLFTYLYLKDLKVSSTGSLLSGLIFLLSGYLLSVHSLLTTLLSVVWTPLVMMFFRRAMVSPGFRNEIFTAIFITLSFLGGGIEVVYGNFFVLLIMLMFHNAGKSLSGLLKWATAEGRPYLTFLKISRSLLAISIIFLFLSAIQLLPFLELWIHSIRGSGLSYQEATVWSLAPKDILLFFLPDAYGYFLDMKKYWVTQCWLKTMYTGGLPFLLSLIFFFTSWKTRTEKRELGKNPLFFLSLMLFSLFLALGKYNPLYPLVFKYVPFFNGIRYPVKFLYIFVLCLAITAGLGFEKIRQFPKEGKRFKHLLMALSILSGIGLLTLVLGHGQVEHFLRAKEFDFPHFNHLSVNLFHVKRFLFYLSLFFLLLRIGHEVEWKGWVKVLLIFFLTADLFGNMGFYGKEKTPDYFKKTEILKMLTADKDFFRSFSTAKTIAFDTPILIGNSIPFDLVKEKHLPSFNMIFRIHDIWGVDVIRLKRSDDLYKGMTSLPSISSSSLVDLYGVKYVVSVTPIEDPHFELIYAKLEGLEGSREDLLKQPTVKLYRNRSPFPRAWLVRDYKVMDSKAILKGLINRDFKPEKEVLLEAPPLLLDGQEDKARKNGKVEFLSETNNRLRLRAEIEAEAILVLSDTYYPGWKVFVDGREKKILRANYNFRAVVLPSGAHQVDFVYSPLSYQLGAGITWIGAAALFIGWTIRRRKDLLKIKGVKR